MEYQYSKFNFTSKKVMNSAIEWIETVESYCDDVNHVVLGTAVVMATTWSSSQLVFSAGYITIGDSCIDQVVTKYDLDQIKQVIINHAV